MKKQHTTRNFMVTLAVIFCVFYAFYHSTVNAYAYEFAEALKPVPRTYKMEEVVKNFEPLEVTFEIKETKPKEIIEIEKQPEASVEAKTNTYIPGDTWKGEVLNAYIGTIEGPSGKETYYNLPMGGVVKIMEDMGYTFEYSVREDGVKMYGPYVMVAANLDIYPRGSIVQTSLGTGIVCDTGEFVHMCLDNCGHSENCRNLYQFDIAVAW